MRSAGDVQWWRFTPAASGTYRVVLGDLPRNYSLAVYRPGGSESTSSSRLSDRTISVTVQAGQRVTIRVGVESGGYSATTPYRLAVTSGS